MFLTTYTTYPEVYAQGVARLAGPAVTARSTRLQSDVTVGRGAGVDRDPSDIT